jgi:uncharacterized protein (UPF0335 family)
MAKGHNFYGGLSAEHLKQCIERIEHIQSEIADLQDSKKDIFNEAKGAGFDTKVIRQILKIRKMDKAELQEFEYLFDTYRQALGMIPDLFDENENPAIKENIEATE